MGHWNSRVGREPNQGKGCMGKYGGGHSIEMWKKRTNIFVPEESNARCEINYLYSINRKSEIEFKICKHNDRSIDIDKPQTSESRLENS